MILASLLSRRGAAQRQRLQAETLLLDHLPLIERVATRAAVRGGFSGPDVEDFVSQVKVKLIDDDYAVIGKRRGDSKLTTFLVAVIHNHFRDYRNHKWGKYRPTAEAQRRGPDAVLLETLLVRDGLELDTAIEMMITNHRVECDRATLRALAERLPNRVGRSFVDDAVLETRGVDGAVEQRTLDRERHATATRVEQVLAERLSTFESQDVLLLKMHLRDAVPISCLARMFGVEQRSLYARKDKCLRGLRRAMEEQGLTWHRVREILGWESLTMAILDGDSDASTHQTRNSDPESV